MSDLNGYHRRTTQSSSPNVAVIGCGYWGKNLVRNFREIGVLRTVCDLTEAGRTLAAGLAPNAKIVGTVEDIFSDSSIDGVVIATPAETHLSVAQQALEAGKDLLVEKPLALTYEDGKQLVDLAKEKSAILAVGHVLEYHPAILKLQALIANGDLGKVQYIYSNRLNLGKIRQEENILWSFAPHDIAVILRLIGGQPFQVTASGGSYVQPNIADVTVTNMLFDNGVRAHLFVSWLHPFKEQRLVVVGSKKMASFDDVSKELVLYDQRVEVHPEGPVPVKGEGERVDFGSEEPLRQECLAFLDAIETRQPPITDGESGLRVLKVLQAAQRSLVTGGEKISVGGF